MRALKFVALIVLLGFLTINGLLVFAGNREAAMETAAAANPVFLPTLTEAAPSEPELTASATVVPATPVVTAAISATTAAPKATKAPVKTQAATAVPTQTPVKTSTPAPTAFKCIITISGKRYDVTQLRNTHSGGNVFVCGTDQTQLFFSQHNQQFLNTVMVKYLI